MQAYTHVEMLQGWGPDTAHVDPCSDWQTPQNPQLLLSIFHLPPAPVETWLALDTIMAQTASQEETASSGLYLQMPQDQGWRPGCAPYTSGPLPHYLTLFKSHCSSETQLPSYIHLHCCHLWPGHTSIH